MEYCKHCGKRLDEDTRFCPGCGTPTTSTPQGPDTGTPAPTQPATTPPTPIPTPTVENPESPDAQGPSHKRRNLIIAIAAAIVVTALVVAFVILRGRSSGGGIMHTSSSPVGTWSAWKTYGNEKPDYSKKPYYQITFDGDGKASGIIDGVTLNGEYRKDSKSRSQQQPEDADASNFYAVNDIAMSGDIFDMNIAPDVHFMVPKSGIIGKWSASFEFLQGSETGYAEIMRNGTIRASYGTTDHREGTTAGTWTPVPCDRKDLLRYKLTFGDDTWWVQGPKANLKAK